MKKRVCHENTEENILYTFIIIPSCTDVVNREARDTNHTILIR